MGKRVALSHLTDIHHILVDLGYEPEKSLILELSKAVPAEVPDKRYFIKAALDLMEQEKKIIRLPKK